MISLLDIEWSCYRGGQYNAGRMVMLQRLSLQWMENGHVTEVVILMEVANLKEGEWLLQRWPEGE